jgi:hypothetical protein
MSLTICSEGKLSISDDEHVFLNDEFGNAVFEVGETFLTDIDGVTQQEIESSVSTDDGETLYTSVIADDSSLASINFPATVSTTIDFSHTNLASGTIRDKFFEQGTDYLVADTNTITVGKSAIVAINEFGENYNPVYKGVYELTLPDIDPSKIIEAGLVLTRGSGVLSQISACEITNLSYDYVNGQSSLEISYSASSAILGNKFTLDLTSSVSESLESGSNCLTLLLAGTEDYKLANIKSVESANYPPLFYVRYDNIGTSRYGAATSYVAMNDASVNCFGYAAGVNDWLTYDTSLYYISITEQTYYYSIVPAVMDELSEQNIESRALSTINSPIYPDERRIAFRVGNYETHIFSDFHFMREHDDGTWSHKPGSTNSIHLNTGLNPDNVSWSNTIVYNSPIIYFAIIC